MRLNLITLALLGFATTASAYDFGFHNANTEKLNTKRWKCKKCVSNTEWQGEIGIALGSAIQDDDHAENWTNQTDGLAGDLQADLRKVAESGIRTELHAAKYDDINARIWNPANWSVSAGYRYFSLADSLNGTTDVLIDPDNNVVWSLPESALVIEKERDRFDLALSYQHELLKGYLDLNYQDRGGSKRSSITNGSYQAQNITTPIDDAVTNLKTGAVLKGSNWLAELGYIGSWYENDNLGLSYQWLTGDTLSSETYTQSNANDNSAQSLFLSGRYNWGKTQASARISQGMMQQDSGIISWTGYTGATRHPDIEVDSTNIDLSLSSRLSRSLRVRASYAYSDRDDQTNLDDSLAIYVDPITGETDTYQALDITRSRYKLNADYRIMQGLKAAGGVSFKQTEREYGEREDTDDTEVWTNLSWKQSDIARFKLSYSYSERDGSTYNSLYLDERDIATAARKYHLADRTRNKTTISVALQPLQQLSLDASAWYALDEYDNTDIGLRESEDYGWNGSASWAAMKGLSLGMFGGYQWIDNAQQGSDNGEYISWKAINDDEFGYFGINLNYRGLQESLGLTLSADYQLAYSESWTNTSSAGYLGDYRSFSHSVKLHADYALSDKATLGMSYQYERWFDNDYADLDANDDPVPQLATLGDLGNNYVAHVIMATWRYKF